MRLVLELQKPFLHLAVHIDVNEDGASVVLFAHLQVVQEPFLLQVAGTDGSQLHEAERFVLAAEFHTDVTEGLQLLLYIVFDERLLHLYILQNGSERSMAAVVRPIGIEYPQFGLCRFAVLFPEIIDYASEVIGIHCQSPLLAERRVLLASHGGEACHGSQWFHIGGLLALQKVEVLLSRLHGVDIIVPDTRHLLVRHGILEDQQPAGADVYVRVRVNQMHTVDGRRSALVKLPGNELYRQVALAFQRYGVRHIIGNGLAKDAVTALLQQFLAEPEEVVHAQIAHLLDVQLEVFVQLVPQALRLYAKSFFLLNKKPFVHVK